MLWDILYEPGGNRPVFFKAALRGGVLDVPATPEAAEATSNGGGAT